ncbi:MAG: anhydro-N-acetylmuramic acid kinase [Burkholderiaceae bacterium]
MTELYIGLMSGTSLDGIDGVLADFAAPGPDPLRVVAHAHRPFAPGLADELLALNSAGADELHRAALAGNALARGYADVVEALLASSGAPRAQVRAIGAHGQTVRHRPSEFDGTGYTVQLNSPALLAELCGIDVIADLRSRDLAAGGQGAPLVPAFHRAVFGRTGETVAVLNLGGMGNLTALRADGSTIGFDCGPGNALLDHWCRRHTGQPYDDGGAWAASGCVIGGLLQRMLADPYFALPPPKSTGRDLFNPDWLQARLTVCDATAPPADVQATLAELTAAACAADVQAHAAGARVLLVCGGGALNRDLMRRIATRLPEVDVMRTDARGLPADQVEACAFAWLARAFVRRECASLTSVTGATGPRVLGALYPAG